MTGLELLLILTVALLIVTNVIALAFSIMALQSARGIKVGAALVARNNTELLAAVLSRQTNVPGVSALAIKEMLAARSVQEAQTIPSNENTGSGGFSSGVSIEGILE